MSNQHRTKNPRRRHRLFVPSSHRSRNVHFHGCLHPVETFEFFADAYQKAGRVLFEQFTPQVLLRIYAAPVVFLFRHSLELRLKEALISGQTLLIQESKQSFTLLEILKSKHSLLDLWNKLQRMYAAIGWEWDTTLKDCGDIVEELHSVDKQSFGFRYPVDLGCKSALAWGFEFDLKRFCKLMDVVLKRISLISRQVEQTLDGWNQAGYA